MRYRCLALPILVMALILHGCITFAPPVAQVFPVGLADGNDGDTIEITGDDLEAVAHAANVQATPVPVLYEHAHGTKAGAAAGFILRCEVRPRGLFCPFRWTEEGQRAACGGGWRYISPRFTYRTDPDTKRIHPTKLIEVSLTNVPLMEGMAPVPVPVCPLAMFAERMAR